LKKIKILALISAILTALSLFLFLNSLKQEVVKGKVLIATANIPEDTVITKDMVILTEWPDEAIHPDALSDAALALGLVAKSDIAVGEQILKSKLLTAGDNNSNSTLAYAIEPGMRAITIAVDDISGLAGMLKPGNKVDILAQFSVEQNVLNPGSSSDNRMIMYTKMLLQNITVLAVDSVLTKSGKAAGKDGTASYASITLQVTPEQAMKTSFSEYSGKLKVILRSPLDEDSKNLPNLTIKDVLLN